MEQKEEIRNRRPDFTLFGEKRGDNMIRGKDAGSNQLGRRKTLLQSTEIISMPMKITQQGWEKPA